MAGFVFAPGGYGADCYQFLSSKAKSVGDFEICHSDLNGKREAYSCKWYVDNDKVYALMFQGGPTPKAIIHWHRSEAPNDSTLLWKNPDQDAPIQCHPDMPIQHISAAVYRGTGVCRNMNNREVPCSLYDQIVDTNDRVNEYQRYLVLYDPAGAGPVQIDVTKAHGLEGISQNLRQAEMHFRAELAFQLGRAMWDTECCRERGVAYLRYAHELNPDSVVYREVYLNLVLRLGMPTESNQY